MILKDEEAMLDFGARLAANLESGDIVAVDGTLGAGKTVLCRGILHGLGFKGEVSSPSYAIVHEYHPPDTRLPVMHADLYRVESPEEFVELGLLEDLGDTLILVEWAERFPGLCARASKRINITPQADGGRLLDII